MSKNCKQEQLCFNGLEDVSGALVHKPSIQERQFSPYSESPFGYAGEMEDESGLVYLRARYYNRNMGIFMSLDPHEGTPTRPMSLNGYAYAEGNPVNNTDPSGRQVSASDCDRTPDNVSDDIQIRCDYARRLNEVYPESGDLDYWLRFSKEGLREAYSIARDRRNAGEGLLGDNLAIVPLDYQAVTGQNARPASFQQDALNALRRLEAQLDRPATFVELLAITIRGELADLLNAGSLPESACGLETAQFQRLVRNAARRYFHGQCRRDGRFGDAIPDGMNGVTGECGPGRLIGTTMSNVESFYDSMQPIAGYEAWVDVARDMIANSPQPTGYACEGQFGSTYNEPFIWGNFSSEPTIGTNNVMDHIEYDTGGTRGFTHFAVQYSAACTSNVRCAHVADYGVSNQSSSNVPDPTRIVGLTC